MHDQLQQHYDDALAWVNQIRERYNCATIDALPKGDCGDDLRCPVANGLPGVCSVSSMSAMLTEYSDQWVDVPNEVADFIAAFDQRYYPELIA